MLVSISQTALAYLVMPTQRERAVWDGNKCFPKLARIGNSFLVLLGCPFERYDLGTTKTQDQQKHDIEFPQNRLVWSGSQLMIVQNIWMFSICEIYWEYGTADHLVFWKCWPAVELKKVLSVTKHGARSIQPKFPEISVQNSMERLGPTGKVSKKLVHVLRWSSFPGRTGLDFGWIDRAHGFVSWAQRKPNTWLVLIDIW